MSVVLWVLSLNIHTLRFKKNPSLLLMFIENLSENMEGGNGHGKQITPMFLNKAFSDKST